MAQAQDTFWSRRRKAVASEELAAKLAIEAEAQAVEKVAQEKAISEKTDEELLAELELPNPDTLKMGDDFSVFMQKAVPDRLRRRALRTLWRSNPVLANLDGLVDHGEDYTDAAVTFEGMKSAYVVGKVMSKMVAYTHTRETQTVRSGCATYRDCMYSRIYEAFHRALSDQRAPLCRCEKHVFTR